VVLKKVEDLKPHQAPWENWDLLAKAIGGGANMPRSRAAQRAVEILRALLGEDWLSAQSSHIPSELIHASSHTTAFVRLLTLALRLDEFAQAPGAAVLRRNLASDRRPESWRHVQLQLEVAALTRAEGAEIAFELGAKDAWPADIVATHGGSTLPIEAFAIYTSQDWRAADDASAEIADRLMTCQMRDDLSIVADFHGSVLASDELEDWLLRVEAAAEAVASDGLARTIVQGSVSAAIAPAGDGPPSRFSGPPIVFNGWSRILRRLEQKSIQASASLDNVWLRVDLLDGVWQFTE
jgi:hypothetical protein